MNKKSEEELERIANLITAEMIRDLNKAKAEDGGEDLEAGADDAEETEES